MSEKTKYISRFSVPQRIEHWILLVSFTTLALTGLPQKYPTAGISEFLIAVLGGIELTRIIHRVAAVIFFLQSAYHLIVVGYKLYVLRQKATMLPGLKDVKDGIQATLHNLGFRKEGPRMGRYNFGEKLEYWAMIWGLILMGGTGLMLWNPIATTKLLPGQFIPAAKIAHGLEAVLAVLAILIWHFYNVHLKKWNWSIFNGKMSRQEMEEEHALELQELEEGEVVPPPAPAMKKKRTTIFAPIAGVLALVLAFGIFRFATFEESALTTVPPIGSAVPRFVRQTATTLPTKPPTPTALPTKPPEPTSATQPTAAPGGAGGLTWASGIGQLFADNCVACHGALGGLSVADYASVMKGGTSGVMIVPGNVDGSSLIKKMEGAHAKVFSSADLQKIKDWIKAGALEK